MTASKPCTREDIVATYRVFLGREPESEAVVERHLANSRTRDDFLTNVLRSKEFYRHNFRGLSRYIFGIAPRNAVTDIQVDCDPAELNALFQHVQSVWSMLGEQRPHFSVLSNKIYSPDTIGNNIDSFNDSGRSEIDHIFDRLSLVGLTPPRQGRAIELGCGVGRVTRFLAQRFEETVGYDISKNHLDIAKTYLEKSGTRGFELRHIEDVRSFSVVPHDFFYSRIVLQHSPPPIMSYMLDRIFGATRMNGIVVFQLPVAIDGYKFDAKDYLNVGKTNDQELHVLPQACVFRMMADHGIVPFEMYRDGSLTGFDKLSATFIGQKLSSGPKG